MSALTILFILAPRSFSKECFLLYNAQKIILNFLYQVNKILGNNLIEMSKK